MADTLHFFCNTDNSNSGFPFTRAETSNQYKVVGFDTGDTGTAIAVGDTITFSTSTLTGTVAAIYYNASTNWSTGADGLIIWSHSSGATSPVDGEEVRVGGTRRATTNVSSTLIWGQSGDAAARSSLSSVETFLDAMTDLSGLDVVIHCLGTTEDTARARFFGWASAPASLTIVGDDGTVLAATGPTNDGKYDLTTFWSTSHYRINVSANNQTIQFDDTTLDGADIVIDGLQVENSKEDGTATVEIIEHVGGAYGSVRVTKCRIRIPHTNTKSSGNIVAVSWPGNGSTATGPNEISNNILQKTGSYTNGTVYGTSFNSAGWNTVNLLNNTIDGQSDAMTRGLSVGGNADGTTNCYGNAIINCTNAYQPGGSDTSNTGDNWTDINDPTAGVNEYTTGTITDHFTDPDNAAAASADYTPVDGGDLDDGGNASNRTSADINGAAWVTDDAGALIAASGIIVSGTLAAAAAVLAASGAVNVAASGTPAAATAGTAGGVAPTVAGAGTPATGAATTAGAVAMAVALSGDLDAGTATLVATVTELAESPNLIRPLTATVTPIARTVSVAALSRSAAIT